MIEMIVGVTSTGIMSDPRAVIVNVGRVWMSRFVAEVAGAAVMRRAAPHRRRTVIWNASTAEAVHTATDATMLPATATTMLSAATASALCIGGDRTRQRKR
jgi:hypothetical protein